MNANSSVKMGHQVHSQNMLMHTSAASVLFLPPVGDGGCLLYRRGQRG